MTYEDVAPYPYACPVSPDGAHSFKRMAAKEWDPQTMTVWCTSCCAVRRLPADGLISPLDDMDAEEIALRLLGGK